MNSPSSSRSSITVGAISIDDSVTNFSNRRLFVDVYGPGRFITSACSAAASCTGLYATYSGTSMSCPHASGVVALWLSQTNEVAADPLQLRKVIECTGSRGVITGLGKNDKNVILQVPDSSTSLRAAVCAEVDSGCGGCPRNAECYYGQCICGDYWDGAQCTVMNPYISSLYASNVFVYGGSIDVSVDSSPPYNTLAFHWALYAYESQSATAYAGPITTKDGRRAYVVVFHRAPRQQASVGTICLVTVEVVLYLDDFSIDVVLVSSDGTACTQDSKSAVVTGFKGARFSEDVPSTVQSALLSVTNKKPPLSAKWTLVPTGVSTSSQPTFSPSFRPTNSGTISPTQKPTVKPTVKSTIKPTIKPSARPTLQPTFGPTVLRSQDPLCSTPFVTFLLSSALERMDRTGESQVDYGTVAGYQVVVRSNTRSLFATKDSQTIVCQEASVFSPTNSPAMISSPSPAPINQPLCSQPFVKLLLSEGLAKIDREGIAFVDYGLVNQYAVVVDAGSRCLTASKGTEIIVCC